MADFAAKIDAEIEDSNDTNTPTTSEGYEGPSKLS